MTRKKSKMGRPLRHGAERLSKSRTFRVRPHLDELLQKAAAKAGRSVSEEIEHRLDQSFEMADLIAGAFRAAYGESNGDLMRAIATVIWLIERRSGKKWNEDQFTAFEVKSAIDGVVTALTAPKRAAFHLRRARRAPSSDREGEPAWGVEIRQRMDMGKGAALEALQKMGMAPSDTEMDEAVKRFQAQEAEFAKTTQAQEVEKK